MEACLEHEDPRPACHRERRGGGVARAVGADLVRLVLAGPAAPDEQPVDLAPQAQSEHRLQPHRGDKRQADRLGQPTPDAVVGDDRHRASHRQAERRGEALGFGRHPLRRLSPGHPAGQQAGRATRDPEGQADEEVGEEVCGRGLQYPVPVLEIRIAERRDAQHHGRSGRRAHQVLIDHWPGQLPAIGGAGVQNVVGKPNRHGRPPLFLRLQVQVTPPGRPRDGAGGSCLRAALGSRLMHIRRPARAT